MKEQLTKFKTQYDVKANYDERGLFQAKKEVYQQEIAVSDRMAQATVQQFTLKPLQITFIQSLALKDDPKFKEIQKIFAKYNADVVVMTRNPAEGLHLKKVVMESMLKFLRMMMLAPDTTSKKAILDISYFWLIKHLNPKSQRKPKTQLLRDIKKIVSDHHLLPQQLIDSELPSHKLKADLLEYRIKARTEHADLDAPEHELDNYHIHKVGYITDKGGRFDDEEERRRKRLMRVKFIRPNLEQYYLPPPEEEQKEPDKLPMPQSAIVPAVVPQEGQLPAVGADGQPLPPEEPAMSPEMVAQMQLLNQMGGEPDQPEQAAVQEDESKKRGKLDPLVKVFLRRQEEERERQRERSKEAPVNQHQRFRNNYKEVLQRQDEMMARYMNDWASKRSRFKSQMARRVQSIRMNHNQTATLPQPLPSHIDPFHQTRISEAIRDGRSYIKGEPNREQLNTEGSLSCFDRRRVKTVAASGNKSFAEVLEENKRARLREESLEQIAGIKEKFAKQKIYGSLNAMKRGLMHVEEGQGQDGQEGELRVQYPTSLLSNPFFVVKKKKKKKGKKKK